MPSRVVMVVMVLRAAVKRDEPGWAQGEAEPAGCIMHFIIIWSPESLFPNPHTQSINILLCYPLCVSMDWMPPRANQSQKVVMWQGTMAGPAKAGTPRMSTSAQCAYGAA